MRTVDLFAGCGGMSLGFEKAGYDVVAAFDNWAAAVNTYRQNFIHPIETVDLSSPEAANMVASYRPELIIGGPPCQDFSSAGKRNEDLGRGDLSIAFARIVERASPHYFIMENVDRILKSRKLGLATDILRQAGYSMFATILDASLCGVPQARKRFFMIGGQDLNPVLLEQIIQKRQSTRPMTVRAYFGERLKINHYYRHPRSYMRRGIFSVDEPSPTIRGVNRPIPKGYPGHPGDPVQVNEALRPLSFEERAQIQTFPLDFKFWGNKSEREQQIGNAVPVNLAKFVALALSEYRQMKSTVYQPLAGAEVFAMEPG